MRWRRQTIVLAADHQCRHRDALERVVQFERGHRDSDAGTRVGRRGDEHPLIEGDLRRGRFGPERDVADRRVARGRRGARERCPRAQEAVDGERLVDRLGEPRDREQQRLGDQVPDARVDHRDGEHPLRDVVTLGPCGNRHRAQGVARDGGAATFRHTGLQHRLEIFAEALDRVVVVGRGIAVAVPAQVVCDDPNALGGQVADHVGPEVERLGPAMGQHERGAVLGSEHLGVQHRAVGGANRERTAGQGIAERIVLGIALDAVPVPALDESAADASGGQRGRAGSRPDPAVGQLPHPAPKATSP